MSEQTRIEVLRKLRRRYETAGAEHKRTLLDQAQELLGYHRKSAIRALRARAVVSSPAVLTGRPVTYEPGLLAHLSLLGTKTVYFLHLTCSGAA